MGYKGDVKLIIRLNVENKTHDHGGPRKKKSETAPSHLNHLIYLPLDLNRFLQSGDDFAVGLNFVEG